jgi:hypothetical protein
MTERKLRRSQVISTFGPGAIIDLVGESFVAEDAGRWSRRSPRIPFPRLTSYLDVPDLRTPGESVPYFRFPRWMFCPACRRMVRWTTALEAEGSVPTCPSCGDQRKRLVPMRFVAVCQDGHLDDVNWRDWAHSDARRGRNPEQRNCRVMGDLRFESRSDAGSGLQSLVIRCRVCDASRSLENLTGEAAGLRTIGQTCRGGQPWQQQDARVACDKRPVAIQRGASSVYFPHIVSAIDIPPDSTWATVSAPSTRLAQDDDFRFLLEHPDHSLRSHFLDLIEQHTGLDRDLILAELTRQSGHEPTVPAGGSVDDILPDEWSALCNPHAEHHPLDNFITRRAERSASFSAQSAEHEAVGLLDQVIDDVVLVDRLREVRVLKGFRRHKGDKEVSSNLAPQVNHYPAVEVFGEGYFLRLSEQHVAEWEAQPEVVRRCRLLAVRTAEKKTDWLPLPSPRYVLLHTLAHLLLRNTAFEAGYSTSALRERIYSTQKSGPPMAGILIYTAAGDTEGTLGGLARMGEYQRLARLLVTSASGAHWCSFDPVCGESQGQGPDGLSLAACHACALVSETSCVASNRLLDRRLLVDESFGFLRHMVAALEQASGRETG